MSSGLFRVQNVIFDQNRVHRVNTGQTMSTGFKNEFRTVSGQKHHFRPKPSSPGQYGSNHVDQVSKWVPGRFGPKTSILTKTELTRSIRVKPCRPGWKMSFELFFGQNHHFSVKTRFTGLIPIKCFFCVSGWNGLFLILIWIFNFTHINIYYYI